MNHRSKCLAGSLLAGSFLVGVGVSAAADDADDSVFLDERAEDAGGLTADDLTETDLEAFVRAADHVRSLRAEYTPRIEQASGEEALELRGEADGAMVEAIEQAGLDVAEYRRIGHLIDGDDELHARLDRAAAGIE